MAKLINHHSFLVLVLPVLQVNIQQRENRALTERLDAQFTPTFVLFDASGQEVWRSVGQVDADDVRERVAALQ